MIFVIATKVLDIATKISAFYVCAAVILGGFIITLGLLWCLLFIGSKTILKLRHIANSGVNWSKLPLSESVQRVRKTLIRKAERTTRIK